MHFSDRLRDLSYRAARGLTRVPGGRYVRRLGVRALVKYWYREPWSALDLVGVTGTNGKTTTTILIRHLLNEESASAAIGTLGAMLEDGRVLPWKAKAWTTPGPVEMARMQRRLVEEGIECVAMEVTAAALHYGRVDQLAFDTAVFTNLTREHLEIFGTMERYRAAKIELAHRVRDGGTLVINDDDPTWSGVRDSFESGSVVTYGLRSDRADVRASDLRVSGSGTRFTLTAFGARANVDLPLIGEFNVENALAASAVAVSRGCGVNAIAGRLKDAPQVPGRLELITTTPCPVYRDFAHTPDALRAVLRAADSLAKGRILLVFGAPGDRDPGKRPLMGKVAVAGAHEVVVTSLSPRSEDPESILDDVVAGLKSGSYHREPDRRRAIHRILDMAREDDVVLLAGKGHGTHQVVQGRRIPFDERRIVRDYTSA